jgi:pimeloyl-ACP methyl ester carboxylesterase
MMTPTLLLHGALGSAAQFKALQSHLPDNSPSFALNLPGHGGIPANGPFSMQQFSDAVLACLDEKGWSQTNIFGYSMGGYVALWFAWKHPERVRSVTTYGTKLDWTPEVAAGMSRMFDPEKIEAKAPQLAESLAHNHGPEAWKPLCHSTAAFLHDLGHGKGLPSNAYAEIRCPINIGWGDLDHVVSETESSQAAGRIPQGRFEVLPGGKHLIDQVDPIQLVHFMQKML